MKAVLLRTGSAPVLASLVLGSPKVPGTGIFFTGQNNSVSPRSSLSLEIKDNASSKIRRALSETDMIRSANRTSVRLSVLNGTGSRSFPARIPEEENLSDGDEDGRGSLILKRRGLDCGNSGGTWPGNDVLLEELGFSGGGTGKGRNVGGGNGGGDDGKNSFTGGNADQSKIGAYYQEMLKADPGNPLLLRNYGKFLHEVDKDVVRAEEYYGRAILASPGDGEVLSLYGKLIWETQRDDNRAKAYFEHAIQASPGDW
ncbi:hypothetical protein HHK36_028200 [Tetracentron sinense]|uniref:TmcB/TmcC TPR repeats domain-containing protein n=1 Tax=Tetracentron sinense TaxID=13715 RepID=A0A835D2A0_TETSI|nr:hypothetical protein HHK36_028200 [Tetracentron sinense]